MYFKQSKWPSPRVLRSNQKWFVLALLFRPAGLLEVGAHEVVPTRVAIRLGVIPRHSFRVLPRQSFTHAAEHHSITLA